MAYHGTYYGMYYGISVNIIDYTMEHIMDHTMEYHGISLKNDMAYDMEQHWISWSIMEYH